ncbi:MAG: glycerol dehydrogenase [Clostridia bacterium]|nr:glycerol dehydrogenase [Clostridia bacterium]
MSLVAPDAYKTKAAKFPNKFVQARNALSQVSLHTEFLGDKILVIADKIVTELIKDKILSSYKDSDVKVDFEIFNGLCCDDEIYRIQDIVEEKGYNLVFAAGGGRATDTAKIVCDNLNLPIVIIPTIVATDAPSTGLAIKYTSKGEVEEWVFLPKCPDLIIVDTEIVAKAPVKFLKAGMGDALATYFEARTTYQKPGINASMSGVSEMALCISERIYSLIKEYGKQAIIANKNGVVAPALEKIIEVNALMSGVGGENGGGCLPHALYDALEIIPECKKYQHGEIVSFGVLVHLIAECSPLEEIKEYINLCKELDLPVTLSQIGLENVLDDQLYQVAEGVQQSFLMENQKGCLSKKEVVEYIRIADVFGKTY